MDPGVDLLCQLRRATWPRELQFQCRDRGSPDQLLRPGLSVPVSVSGGLGPVPVYRARSRRRSALRSAFGVLLRFPSEADIIVEIISVEPSLDIFASLAVLANVLGKKGERFGIAIRSSSFHVGGPSLDFPWSARCPGIGMNPFEDFTVAFSGVQLLCKSFEVDSEKPDEMLVTRRVEIVFAIFSGELRAAFVENARQQDKAAQADAHAAGGTLS
jgi:hypothetical protein